MNNKKGLIMKLVWIVILGSFSAWVSYAFSVKFLSEYSYGKHDLMNVIFLNGNFNNFDYLACENIFVYFPTLICFFAGYIFICVISKNNIKDMSSFICSRVDSLKQLKKICTENNNMFIFLYMIVYFAVCCLLVSVESRWLSYVICMLERILVLIFLKDLNYIVSRKKDSIHAMLYGLILILFFIMIDALISNISIIAIPADVRHGLCTLVAEFVMCVCIYILSVQNLGKTEVL